MFAFVAGNSAPLAGAEVFGITMLSALLPPPSFLM